MSRLRRTGGRVRSALRRTSRWLHTNVPRLVWLAVFIPVALLTLGTVGYRWIEGEQWSYFDGFYMTAITLTTIGYGEVHELGTNGRIFTVVLAYSGIFTLAYFASELVRAVVTGQLRQVIASMSIEEIGLDDALKLLSLPRVVGKAADGEEITAQNGRYGPYLKKGTDSRSLTSEDQIFDITLAEAEAIYAQPKARGRAASAASGPLKELGADPVSGKPVVVKDGRFGPYVTDGETNATLRRSDSVEAVTLERAAELLAEKRAKGPAPKKTTRRAPAKKTTRK